MNTAYLEMGRVLEAHNHRFYARQLNRQTSSDVECARKDLSNYGIYDDCGDSYQSMYDREVQKARTYLELKISAEKHYKKLKLTFDETYPEYVEELNQLISDQADRHTETIKRDVANEIALKKQRDLEFKIRQHPWRYNPDGTRRKGW